MKLPIDSPRVAKWFVIPILIHLIIACSKVEVDSYPSLYFVVIDSLIGEQQTFSEQNIILHPPVGLLKISGEDFSALQATVQSDTSLYLPTEPLFAGGTPYGLYMVVSQVSTGPDNLAVFNDRYAEYLDNKFPDCEINRTQYSLNDFPTIQYIITSRTSVLIKLYCMNGNRCTQVDYFLNREQYTDIAHILESSIGSINRNNKEETR
ncbi:MAG: hypothetical protein K9N35_12270 [Candidatus Marinimicrobia bacterium]|nr:hypothetical protein [Candidatus Neomarinimicrobiota bacterium]